MTSTGVCLRCRQWGASIVVYQAYRPSIGQFAAQHGYFGGDFKLSRMTWIKPNFLWMMYRSGWGTKEGQEVTLAIRLKRSAAVNYSREWILDIEDISEFVEEQRQHVIAGNYAALLTPSEFAYEVGDRSVGDRLQLLN